MVEVFKTNVEYFSDAKFLIAQIQENFQEYLANFDLQDCDKILRIESRTGKILVPELIDLIRRFGFDAEVLPDDDFIFPQDIIQEVNEILKIKE